MNHRIAVEPGPSGTFQNTTRCARGDRGRIRIGTSIALLAVALVAGCCSAGPADTTADAPAVAAQLLDARRGQLLYEAQCIACHTKQVHWRDASLVNSWSDLVVQVDRWQTNAGQQWGNPEILDVAAYLNAIYYKVPCPTLGCRGDATVQWGAGPTDVAAVGATTRR